MAGDSLAARSARGGGDGWRRGRRSMAWMKGSEAKCSARWWREPQGEIIMGSAAGRKSNGKSRKRRMRRVRRAKGRSWELWCVI